MRGLARLATGAGALALVAAVASCGQQSPQEPRNQAQQPESQQHQSQQAQSQTHNQASDQAQNKAQQPAPQQAQNPSQHPEPQAQQAQNPPQQPEPRRPEPQPAQGHAQNQAQPGQPPANESANQYAAETAGQGEIREIQQALEQKGFRVGRVDGRLGPRTRRALARFQRRQGLQQTGTPDQPTLAALGISGGASTTGQGAPRRGGTGTQPPQQQPPK
jgi:hypothetical protein